MSRSLTVVPTLKLAAIALLAAAGPALAQARAAFPGASRPGGSTPMQRSFSGGRSAGHPSAPPPPMNSPARGWNSWNGAQGGQGDVVVDGSGLTVNGAYTSDNFNLAFHLGGDVGLGTNCYRPVYGNCWYYPGIYYGGWGWYNDYYYDGYYDNSNQRYAVIDGALVQPIVMAAPAPDQTVAPEPPPPPTDLELATRLMLGGDAQGAADKYRTHLRDHPDDADAMRGLAVALLVGGEFDEGVAVMSMAYRTSPSLAAERLNSAAIFSSESNLRKAVVKAVNFANKMKSASSWLTVAVLMQAEGRRDHALRMIERAEELGLDAELAKKFHAVLAK